MNKTPEFNAYVEWAKDAPLTALVDAMSENLRYPSVIRDELKSRLKPNPGVSITDLLWDQFLKENSSHEANAENKRKLKEEEMSNSAPGAFLIQLRENREFWQWAATTNGGIGVFSRGTETMWKKCFDSRLTNSEREKLTDGEIRLIEAFNSALREYKVEKEHDFHAFLNGNEEA